MKTLLHDGFESGFYPYDGELHLEIPSDWIVKHFGNRPEYKPKNRGEHPNEEIFLGDHSASVHVRYNTHDSYLIRSIDVTAGASVRFRCMAMLKSHPNSGHGVCIGIDPYGNTDPLSQDIFWCEWYATHNIPPAEVYTYGSWIDLEVQALAMTGSVALFIRSKNDWAHELAAAHFDEVIVTDSNPDGPIDKSRLNEVHALLQLAVGKLDAILES